MWTQYIINNVTWDFGYQNERIYSDDNRFFICNASTTFEVN